MKVPIEPTITIYKIIAVKTIKMLIGELYIISQNFNKSYEIFKKFIFSSCSKIYILLKLYKGINNFIKKEKNNKNHTFNKFVLATSLLSGVKGNPSSFL